MLIVSIPYGLVSALYGLDDFILLSTIEDTGIGFDMSVMSMIWTPSSNACRSENYSGA